MNQTSAPQAGTAIPMLLVMVLALLLLAGGAIQVSTGRQTLTLEVLSQERAFQAADAGLDHACYLANTVRLAPGQTVTVQMGRGQSFTFSVADMKSDGVDNDANGQVDEAEETGFVVTSLGSYRSARRRLLGYVRRLSLMPAVEALVTCTDPAAALSISGNSFTMRGEDQNPDGSVGPTAGVRGLAIAAPGTVGSVLSGLSLNQRLRITGIGGTPSATVTTPFDVGAFADSLKPIAQNIVAPGTYGAIPNFGSEATNTWRITWCRGSMSLNGGASGAGVLIVDGNLDMLGTSSFSGLVVVKGNLSLKGGGSGKKVWGAVMVEGNVRVNGGADFQYSNLVISKVTDLVNRYTLTGWREISR